MSALRSTTAIAGVLLALLMGSFPSGVRAAVDPTVAWKSIGPASVSTRFNYHISGRVSSIAPEANGDFVIAAANGGIWRRHEGTWINLTAGDLTTLAFGAVAFAPSNPTTLYAGSGEHHGGCPDCGRGVGVFKKVKGEDWRLLDQSPVQRTSAVVVDPNDEKRVWVAGSAGAFLSTDGVYFDSKLKGDITDLKVDPTDMKVVYAADADGIRRSSDGGESWSPAVNKEIRNRDRMNHSSEHYNIALAIAPSDHKTVYAAFASASGDIPGCAIGMLKTTNAGESWSRVPGISVTSNDYFEAVFAFNDGGPSSCQGTYDNALVVDPFDANVVTAGGICLIRSNDGGDTWFRIDQNSRDELAVHADHHALAYDSFQNLLDGNDGGVTTIDPNGKIGDVNDGLEITQFTRGGSSFHDGQDIVAGTQDNGTLTISDALAANSDHHWDTVLEGDGGYTAMNGAARGDFYFEYINGLIYRKLPNEPAKTLYPGKAYGLPGALFYMPFAPAASHFGWIYAGAGQLYVNENFGDEAEWSKLTTRDTTEHVSSFALSAADARTAIAGWTDSEIVSLKSGEPKMVAHPWPADSGAIDDVLWPSDGAVYVVVSGRIWLTRDFDDDSPVWTDISGRLPCAASMLRKVSSGLLAACDDGVYFLDRQQATAEWIRFGAGLPRVPVVDLLVLGNGVVVALTHGRGAWMATLPRDEVAVRK